MPTSKPPRLTLATLATALVLATIATTAVVRSSGQGTRAAAVARPALPAVYLSDPTALSAQRAAFVNGDRQSTSAVNALIRQANRDLTETPVSVMDKSQVASNGDKHEYLSLLVYAWPNPSTKNGLPYVIHDGRMNPEVSTVADQNNLGLMITWVRQLGYAYYFTRNEVYASKARDLLATWFLNPSTRMRPDLSFAQLIKGNPRGQHSGIIDGANLPEVVDAVGLLAGSKTWTKSDDKALHRWFSEYLAWLRKSALGKQEAKAANNHATWYDEQILSYALYAGNRKLARTIATTAKTTIVARQIAGNGRQPAELKRPDSWTYSTFNLDGLTRLATLASAAQVDLWEYTGPDGAGIRKALDFVAPYAKNLQKWPYQQANARPTDHLIAALYAASAGYGNASYYALADDMSATAPTNPAAVLQYAAPTQSSSG
jgi:Alginate lyase